MVSKWALAASFALAIAAAGDATAQTATQWDRKAEPLEGRPGEYRTTTTDTWIRLTPYVGGTFWDGGLMLKPAPMFGLALEFEPADIMIASFDFNANFNVFRGIFGADPAAGWGGSRYYGSVRFRGQLDDQGLDRDQELAGRVFDIAFYVGLKNPELKLGILQPIIGMGAGAWNLSGFDTSLSHGLPQPGFSGAVEGRFPAQWLAHATIFVRLDFDISEHFKLGFNLKNHFIFYATKGESDISQGIDAGPGNMISGKIKMDNTHYAFEPDFYLSIAF